MPLLNASFKNVVPHASANILVCGFNGSGVGNIGYIGLGASVLSKTILTKLTTAFQQAALPPTTGALTHGLALVGTDGTLWVSGNNAQGQLGMGSTVDIPTLTRVGTAVDWESTYFLGIAHFFAIKKNGTLWATGENASGSLGVNSTVAKTVLTQVGTSTNWKKIVGGISTTNQASIYGIQKDNTLWAWGANSNGQLGLGNTTNRLVPIQVGTSTWKDIKATSNSVALGIQTDGSLWSWGTPAVAAEGLLGLGTGVTSTYVPTRIGTSNAWDKFSGNFTSTTAYAMQNDGTLWAWGGNGSGQLGTGGTVNVYTPTQIGGIWRSVNGEHVSRLAVAANGTLWAWGLNTNGQLGQGDTVYRSIPTQIGTASDWDAVLGLGRASKTDGSVYVFGENSYGQLGIGTSIDQLVPILLPNILANDWDFYTGASTSVLVRKVQI